MFDPTVDRLLFIVALVGIIVADAAPLWFCWAIVVRELLVGAMMVVATLVFQMPRIDVSWLGKLATFLLMFAIPGFMLGSSDFPGEHRISDRCMDRRNPRSCTVVDHGRRLRAAGPRRRRRRPERQVNTSTFDTLEHHERSRPVAVLLGP